MGQELIILEENEKCSLTITGRCEVNVVMPSDHLLSRDKQIAGTTFTITTRLSRKKISSRAPYQEPCFFFYVALGLVRSHFLSLRTKTQPGSYIPAAHSYFLFLLFNSRRNGSRVLVLENDLPQAHMNEHQQPVKDKKVADRSCAVESFSYQECPISLLKVLPLVKKKVPRAVKQDLHEERTFPDTLTANNKRRT